MKRLTLYSEIKSYSWRIYETKKEREKIRHENRHWYWRKRP